MGRRGVSLTRRRTIHNLSTAEVLSQYSASPDNCFHSDFQTLNNSGSAADEYPVTNLNAATKRSPWSNVNIRPQPAIMIDSSPGVNNRISANNHISLNDRAGHDLDAFVQIGSGIYPSSRMQEHWKAISSLFHMLINTLSSGRTDQLADAINQFHGSRRQGIKCRIPTQDGYSPPLASDLVRQGRITNPQHLKAGRHNKG